MARIEIHDDDTVDIYINGQTETYSGEKLAHTLEQASSPGGYFRDGKYYTAETVEKALDLYRSAKAIMEDTK